MKKEDAFIEYWKRRWPYSMGNERVLMASASFKETKNAFLAGWDASEPAVQADAKWCGSATCPNNKGNKGDEIYTCNCGGEFFTFTKIGARCIRCGILHEEF